MKSKNNSYSFLIPTRKRIQSLSNCINSIIEKTYNLNNIEIILGIDSDDVETINFDLSSYEAKNIKIKKIIMDRYSGYEDQPIRLKEMIKSSSKDYLIHFADDMQIITDHWDLILNDQVDRLNQDLIYLLYPAHNQPNKNWPLCQIISRKWTEITGKFTNCFETDTELLFISSILKRIIRLDNFKIFLDCKKLNEEINSNIQNKILRILKIFIVFIPRILFIKKNYEINYFHVFIKNIINLKI